jgi:hypothetical protein
MCGVTGGFESALRELCAVRSRCGALLERGAAALQRARRAAFAVESPGDSGPPRRGACALNVRLAREVMA